MSKDTLHEQIREAFRQESEHGLPPEPEPRPVLRPVVTFDYPSQVSVYSGCLVDPEHIAVFQDPRVETPLCKKLGGDAYRLELRFYRVEGGE